MSVELMDWIGSDNSLAQSDQTPNYFLLEARTNHIAINAKAYYQLSMHIPSSDRIPCRATLIGVHTPVRDEIRIINLGPSRKVC